jgi:hypothetical protein
MRPYLLRSVEQVVDLIASCSCRATVAVRAGWLVPVEVVDRMAQRASSARAGQRGAAEVVAASLPRRRRAEAVLRLPGLATRPKGQIPNSAEAS